LNTHVPFMIPEEVRAPLNRIAVPQSIPANTVLFRLGDPVQGVYLIHSGTVALSLPNAVEPPRITGPGAVLGIPASICDRPYSLTAETLEPVEAGFISREDFVAVVRQDPDLCFAVIASVAEALADTRRQASALLGQFATLE
jgi:CRP-like cAMP-binding protein